MNRLIIWALACGLLFAAPATRAESRTWTNTAGKTVQAELVSKDADQVTVKLPNGKTAQIKLTDLSRNDQDYIASWTAPKEDATATDKEAKKDVRFKWYKRDKEAFKVAKEAQVPIVLLFTGTSWCGYCVKLDAEVINKPKFKSGLDGIAIGLLCISESPGKYKGEWAEQLAKKYGGGGVPRMVVLSPEGNTLGTIGGYIKDIGPEGYANKIRKMAGAPPIGETPAGK